MFPSALSFMSFECVFALKIRFAFKGMDAQEILWWRVESTWEAKSIPIGDFLFSVRELAFILSFVLIGSLIAIFVPLMPFKLLVFFVFLLIGFMLSRTPSNTVPWELTFVYRLISGKTQKPVPVQTPKIAKQEERLATIPSVPIAFTGEVSVEKQEQVTLFVDGRERGSVFVSPSNPKYRIYYIPEKTEGGVHEIEIRLGNETITRTKVEVKQA
ncbi:hypothetical protein B9Q01_08945 [Candidatus Marsarchaeota G1 archaeon OSP_D]|uniref:Uncharacterized protein n=2 Tax=Candidatus Marsarchaeota group 1 TaxID=2203770 RepID=A0A2R6A6Y0_9ARCH|nr:MAG: hypothetical protein B9Q01_08945 [Candidatus Marsarchaeota G1 archaeon OSP_D]